MWISDFAVLVKRIQDMCLVEWYNKDSWRGSGLSLGRNSVEISVEVGTASRILTQ